MFDNSIWNVESRAALGSLRTNNAAESFRDAFSKEDAQAGRLSTYRIIQSLHLQQKTYQAEQRARRVAPQPLTGREVAEIEQGRTREFDKRQEERIGRLRNLIVQYQNRRNAIRLLRCVDWN